MYIRKLGQKYIYIHLQSNNVYIFIYNFQDNNIQKKR